MESNVLLYYKYILVPSPLEEVKKHKEICKSLGILGRILIGKEGINGTVQGSASKIQKYKNYLNNHHLFNNIIFKETKSKKKAFQKLKVKVRDEIVTLNRRVDLNKAAAKISAEKLHELLDKKEEVVLIDMRNGYESDIGRFRNAVTVDTKNFRDLPEKLSVLSKFKEKKVVTYCTGGIRCEKASALLVEDGFKDVYQLDGGIFKYGEKFPEGYFEGKCFVFDERMSVAFSKTSAVLTKCEHCSLPSDSYIDCSDNLCHRLFICCSFCQEKFQSFCSKSHQVKMEMSSFV